ncbi:MAG: general secretion pathway protein GspB, partial [Steroidobacteraceae bacterium]
SPLDGTAEYAPEIPVAPPARSEPRVSAPVRRADAVPHADAPAAVADTDAEEALPTVSEINLSGSQALPDLHLDVHVYATKPAERFVYINMRKYHEGARMQEGPTVERIRRDGVVLSYQGLRFLLPRQP